MNRRQFLTTIGLVTGAAALGKVVSLTGPQPDHNRPAPGPTSQTQVPLEVPYLLSSKEIAEHFTLMHDPVELINGKPHAAYTRQLPMLISPPDFSSDYIARWKQIRSEAIQQIKATGMTHVYVVLIGGYLYNPQTLECLGQPVYARGCIVNP